MVENNSSASSDDQQVEVVYDSDDSVDSSVTSGAPGMKAGRHSAFTSSPYTTPEVERDGVTSSVETSPGTHDTPDVERDGVTSSVETSPGTHDTPDVERDGVTSSVETSPGTHDTPDEINDEDIERMMMSLKGTDHGFLGFCSKVKDDYFNIGDTFECQVDNEYSHNGQLKTCTITRGPFPGEHGESCTY